MSKPCRSCGAPIDFRQEAGRWVPIDPETREPHRETCAAARGQVPDRIKRPTRHAISPSRVKRHDECHHRFYLEVVLDLGGEDVSDDLDSGKLVHGTIEAVAVERARANDLARPVTGEELVRVLEEVVSPRERWTSESLAHARAVLLRSAHRVDLSLVAVDEHGAFVERGFELPIGEGATAGGTIDLVEDLGDLIVVRDWKGGAMRDPEPAKIPAVGIYARWVRLLWPGREVRVVVDYLALGLEDEIHGDELVEAEERAMGAARALVLKVRRRAQDPGAWPATFGTHCTRCPFTGRCETYRVRMAEHVPEREPETLEELVVAIHRAAPVATVWRKKVDSWRDRAKQLVGLAVDADGRAVIAGHPVRLRTVQRDGYRVDPTTFQVLDVEDRDEALDVVDVKATAALPGPVAPEVPARASEAGAAEAIVAEAGAPNALRPAEQTPAGERGGAGVSADVLVASEAAPAPVGQVAPPPVLAPAPDLDVGRLLVPLEGMEPEPDRLAALRKPRRRRKSEATS